MKHTSRVTTRNVFKSFAHESANSSKNTLSPVAGQWHELTTFRSNALVGGSTSCPLEWDERDYRQAAVEATVHNQIAWGLRVNREERGLTQAALAKLMGTGQSAISKLEDPEGGDVQLSTLIKAAEAFDCALSVRLVSHLDLFLETQDVRSERLFACSYDSHPLVRIIHGSSEEA